MPAKTPKTLATTPKGRVYVYRLSAAGQWSYGKNPVTDPELARQFFAAITNDSDGKYLLLCEGELCQVRVEDAPSFVEDVALTENARKQLTSATIHLASGEREPLDPATLESGRGGALYCTDSRGLRTRFQRKPHLELSRYIMERDGRYVLPLGGKEYEVRLAPEEKP